VYEVGLFLDGIEVSSAQGGSKKGAEQQAAEIAFKKVTNEKEASS